MEKILTDRFLASLPIRREDDDIEFKSADGGFPDLFGRVILRLPIRMEVISSLESRR